MEVTELGKLLQMRDPQGLTRDLRKIVAKTDTLHLNALLTGQHTTGLCAEFSWSGRYRNSCGYLFQDLSESGGMLFVEREILAEQRCGDYCQTGLGSQRGEKRLWEVSWRQWPERAAGNRENG